MSPLLRKALTIAGAAKVYKEIQERRRPSRRSRLGKAVLVVGAGAGIVYLAKTNRLQPLIEQAKAFGSNGLAEAQRSLADSRDPLTSTA